MLTEMQCANVFFDRIWYVNTRAPINRNVFDGNEQYVFLYPSSIQRKCASIRALLDFFCLRSLKQIHSFIKNKGFKWHYFRGLARGFAADRCIRPIAQRIINQNEARNCVVLSTWFGACAITAAHLKKRNPMLRAFSLAHSYEILVSRSPNIPYYFVDFKHENLDGVYFIAEIMRDLYINGIGPLKEEYLKRMHVCHLGSIKDDNVLNVSDPSRFNICTCSRMIPLKRLDVLCEALRSWAFGPVKWSHIGGGETEHRVKQLASEVMNNNPLVKIEFLGRKTNKQVKEYYRDNPADVFCNLSSIEGVPISIMEAISYGIPVIATDVGGTKEVVNSQDGFLINRDISADSVRKVLESFVARSLEEKVELRESTYKFWEEHFNAKVNANLFFSIISV